MLQRAALQIEQIAENQQRGNDVRIPAHLLFGEFYAITQGKRITNQQKRDLLKRMKDLITETEERESLPRM